MKVFKFGGASVSTVEGVKNVAKIISTYKSEKLFIVISAMGKTTNALEAVVKAFYQQNKEEALQLFEQIKQQHLTTAKYLLVTQANVTTQQLTDFFTEVEWLLHDKPVREYDYYYDQLVCVGELLSTCIVSAYLNEIGLLNKWVDIRDYLRTDDNFRDANVDLNFTSKKITTFIKENNEPNIIIAQGFIGCTDQNESTTLGREGSDYTAALLASIVQADSVTIWKDVKGVLNADPKQYKDAILLPKLSYAEVIEMAYYGAQVIHPKTIKPLQNANIPLYVKCFLDSSLPGTIISNGTVKNLPPIIVVKHNQVLVTVETKDFSFIGEVPMQDLYRLVNSAKLKPTLTQMGAIMVSMSVDDNALNIEQFALAASSLFNVTIQKGLTLLTMRHYQKEALEKLTAGKDFLLQQKTTETYQALMS